MSDLPLLLLRSAKIFTKQALLGTAEQVLVHMTDARSTDCLFASDAFALCIRHVWVGGRNAHLHPGHEAPAVDARRPDSLSESGRQKDLPTGPRHRQAGLGGDAPLRKVLQSDERASRPL